MRNFFRISYEKLIENLVLELTFRMLRDLNERQVGCKISNQLLPKKEFAQCSMIIDITKRMHQTFTKVTKEKFIVKT